MLSKYLEQVGIGARVDVPEFDTREDAESFIEDLDDNDIVLDDVIDPESGDVLLEAGETKASLNNLENEAKQSSFNKYLKKSQYHGDEEDDDEEEIEDIENHDEAEEDEEESAGDFYELQARTISAEYEAMGEDIMGDWMYDHPDADEIDAEEFINSMADDAISGGIDDEVKQVLRKVGVSDYEGWAADYIADGARKKFKEERG